MKWIEKSYQQKEEERISKHILELSKIIEILKSLNRDYKEGTQWTWRQINRNYSVWKTQGEKYETTWITHQRPEQQ